MLNFFKKYQGAGAIGDTSNFVKSEDLILASGSTFEERDPVSYTVRNQNGSGSCFKAGTLITMEDMSKKPIENITLGEYVISDKNNIQKVTSLFKKKWQGNTYEIKTKGQLTPIIVTGEHPILAKKQTLGKKPILKSSNYINADCLKKNDWVNVTNQSNIVKDLTTKKYEKDPIFLWVLGLYLAEGCIDKYCVTFALHKKETYFLDKIKIFGDKYGANVTHSFKKDSLSLTVKIQGACWPKVFLNAGNKLSDKKMLQEKYMFMEPALQKYIIEGIFDGDGHYSKKGRNVLVSTSKDLIEQTQRMLLRNNIYSFANQRKDVIGKKRTWTLEYSETSRYTFFENNSFYVQVDNVKKISSYASGHVYNIEVENDNTYIANNISVHNCVAQTVAKMLEVEDFKNDKELTVYSATPIYQNRSNKPQAGMIGVEALNFPINNGMYLEKDAPSQNLSDEVMDVMVYDVSKKLKDAPLEKVEVLLNFYKVANWVKNSGAVMVWFKSSYDEWSRDIPSGNSNSEAVRHSVTAVDTVSKNGVEYIIIEDSWGKWLKGSDLPLKDGQRAITKAFFDKHCYFAACYVKWTYNVDIRTDKYQFTYVMKRGSIAPDVKVLQNKLKELGYFPTNVESTGRYGRVTAEAIYKWQIANNIASLSDLNSLRGNSFGLKSINKINTQ